MCICVPRQTVDFNVDFNVPMNRIISVTLLQRRLFVQLFTQPPLKATSTGKWYSLYSLLF